MKAEGLINNGMQLIDQLLANQEVSINRNWIIRYAHVFFCPK